MMCLLPNFTTSGSELKSNISYTVMFGSAPGPDLTVEELTLSVRPDPVFAEDGSALSDNQVSSDLLRIKVRFEPTQCITTITTCIFSG